MTDDRIEPVSVRVIVVSVDGSRAIVENVATKRRYTLQQADALAKYVGDEVDILADVRRSDWTGQLTRFHSLSDEHPLTAWRTWFAPHDEYWYWARTSTEFHDSGDEDRSDVDESEPSCRDPGCRRWH